MLSKLLPLIMALLGTALGAGAGHFLKPPVVVETDDAGAADHAMAETAPDQHDAAEEEAGTADYVKLNNQFVVPIIDDGRVGSLVILSLSLEVAQGATEAIYAMEPKLRDALLRVMWDHANTGGFNGAFTDSNSMAILHNALREAAIRVAGNLVSDVLIADLVRQDS